MKIVSKNSKLLDELFNDFKRKNIDSEKITDTIEGAMGDITIYIALGALGLQAIDTLLNYLSYRNNQKNNYIHFKYKDGTEVKFSSLSKNEKITKLQELKSTFKNLKYIDIG